MADQTLAKHVISIESCEKPFKVPKSTTDELKGAVSAKMLGRMKKEAVVCPLEQKQVCFVQCFACKNFLHRIRGTVGCKGEP